jgi:hypothetical protein
MKPRPLAHPVRRLLPLLLVGLVFAAVAAPAQAFVSGWQAPVGLQTRSAELPAVGGDPSGVVIDGLNQMAMIDQFGRVSVAEPEESWGAPSSATGASAVLPDRTAGLPLARDNRGDLFTAWATPGANCGVAVQVAINRMVSGPQSGWEPPQWAFRLGGWGRPFTVWETSGSECAESPAVSAIHLAVSPRGLDYAVSWQTSTEGPGGPESAVWAADRVYGGAWNEAQRLSSPTATPGASEPTIGADSVGNATVVWQAGSRIFASDSVSGEAWSAPEQLSPGAGYTQAALTVDRDGDAMVAWCAACSGESGAIEVIQRPPSGVWSAPEQISEVGRRPRHPLVALDPGGNAVLAWYREDIRQIRVASKPAGGVWGGPGGKSIPLVGGKLARVGLPVLAVGAGGVAVVAWPSGGAGSRIEAAVRPRGKGWQPAVTVSGGETRRKSQPRVAINEQGTVAVTWWENGSGRVGTGRPLAAEYVPSERALRSPSLTAAIPPAFANGYQPRVTGTAYPDSTVHLFTNSTCSGEPLAVGTGAELDQGGNEPGNARAGIGVSVPRNSTTFFYADATLGADTSPCSKPLVYTQQSGPVTMPEALAAMPALDPLTTAEDPLTGGGSWSPLPWAAGPGFTVETGWSSHQPFPDSEAAYWSRSAILDAGTGIAASARLAASPGVNDRSFSLWIDMRFPKSQSGYELRFTEIGRDTYNVSLESWESSQATNLGTVEDVVLPPGGSFALVDQGSTLSIWVDAGAGFVKLSSVADARLSDGFVGIETSGNGTRLRRFAAGALPVVTP